MPAGAANKLARANQPAPSKSDPNGLLTFEQLPKWQQDNAYIRGSYRAASYSYFKSATSLLYLHNESVNIYTHLFGAALFAILPFFLLQEHERLQLDAQNALLKDPWSKQDAFAFSYFFAGAVICLLMSATYHCISNHSPSVSRWGNQLDYVGIVSLITGSFVPSIYYGFYCHPGYQKLYWGMISILGLACTVVTLLPQFRSSVWRPVRAGMFVGLGLSAIVPVVHGLMMDGWFFLEESIGLRWLILQGALYIAGASLYALRFPERWKPGQFDVWGSSHQIFHVLVVLAATSHLVGLIKAAQYAHTDLRCVNVR